MPRSTRTTIRTRITNALNVVMHKTTSSKGDSMDINTLTATAQQLQQSFSTATWWSNFFIMAIAVSSLFYFVSMLFVTGYAKQLNHANEELIRAKDAQLTTDLKDKDVHIADADEKAAEARATAAKADKAVAQSKEEIARLTAEAEQAKKDRTEADKQIAIAKADAANATKETAKLSLAVQKEARKRAEAERALLELQERLKPRHLTGEQRATLLELLKKIPKGKVKIYAFIGDNEAIDFSAELLEVLTEAGWPVEHAGQHVALFTRGLGILVHDRETAPPYAVFLQNADRKSTRLNSSHVSISYAVF